MRQPPDLTDRPALLNNRARAQKMAAPALFLQLEAISEVQERLVEVNRTFTEPAIVTGFPDLWGDVLPKAKIVTDDEILDLTPGAHDLVIHALCLHWANDPVGQLIQARRALRPDGLFLGVLFGGATLSQLRAVLAEAEVADSRGLSPRIVPMAEIRDLGGLLQRAGFALPVADSTILTATYTSAIHLMRDIRAMGEGNAMAARNRTPMRRAMVDDATQRYDKAFAIDGRIPATFEFVFLTGWAPAENQQKPLRPGSAQQRLADALGATETPLPDQGSHRKD